MKILFVGLHNPSFISIAEYIEKALRRLGHQLQAFDYRQFSIPGRIRDKVYLLHKYDIARINKRLIKASVVFKPDLLFVLQGDTILPETILTIKNKYRIPSANWFIDYPTELGLSLLLAKYYDFFFVSTAPAMAKHHRHGNKSVKTLNFACDPDIHIKQELSADEKRRYGSDVVFVGSKYAERENVLNNLGEFNLGIWGPGWGDLAKGSPLRKFYKAGAIGPEIWVKIFNASKVILNINYGFAQLREEDCNSGSVKLFEILACGGFQMVDAKKAITDIFADKKHLVTFSDTADLKNKMRYYLAHPEEREAIALEGRKEVLAKHTYEHRMQEMLSSLKL